MRGNREHSQIQFPTESDEAASQLQKDKNEKCFGPKVD